MIGKGFTFLFFRAPRQTPSRSVDSLCTQFRSLTIQQSQTPSDLALAMKSKEEQLRKDLYTRRMLWIYATKKVTPFYIQKRYYYPSWPLLKRRDYPDHDHLNEKGAIKEEILQKRTSFLQSHGLLEDRFIFNERIVYANRHLYHAHQIDRYGKTNLERMQGGFSPVTKDGQELVVLHHFDQTDSGPWVVLKDSFHVEYQNELHSNVKMPHGVDRKKFNIEKRTYWIHEAELLEPSKRPTRKWD